MTKTHKWCCKCHTDKPVADFHRSSKRADGVQSVCKLCKSPKATGLATAPAAPPIETRTCTRCGQLRLASDFSKHATICAGCRSAVRRLKFEDPEARPEVVWITPDALRWDRYCDGTYARADVLADLDEIEACLYRIDGYHAKAPDDERTHLAPLVPLLSIVSKTVNSAGFALEPDTLPDDQDNDDEADDVADPLFYADSDALT